MTNFKILLLKKNKKNNNRTLDVTSNKTEKTKNPVKGEIYVHIDQNDYFFYQFNGKKWIEIK